MHRDQLDGVTEDHTIKNADVVRGLLEADGQVLAVFSGHDHRGEIAVRNGIHYFVLEGNVGMSLDWSIVSLTDGMDPVKDCPFTLVEIKEKNQKYSFNGMKTYTVILKATPSNTATRIRCRSSSRNGRRRALEAALHGGRPRVCFDGFSAAVQLRAAEVLPRAELRHGCPRSGPAQEAISDLPGRRRSH